MIRYGWMLVLAATLVACGESQPTAAVCTRPDDGSPCGMESTATQVQPEAWAVTFRTTITEEVEYQDGGVQCVLTRQTCVTVECFYSRSPDIPPPHGWFVTVDDETYSWGEGDDTAEEAIKACGEWWLLYG